MFRDISVGFSPKPLLVGVVNFCQLNLIEQTEAPMMRADTDNWWNQSCSRPTDNRQFCSLSGNKAADVAPNGAKHISFASSIRLSLKHA